MSIFIHSFGINLANIFGFNKQIYVKVFIMFQRVFTYDYCIFKNFTYKKQSGQISSL